MRVECPDLSWLVSPRRVWPPQQPSPPLLINLSPEWVGELRIFFFGSSFCIRNLLTLTTEGLFFAIRLQISSYQLVISYIFMSEGLYPFPQHFDGVILIGVILKLNWTFFHQISSHPRREFPERKEITTKNSRNGREREKRKERKGNSKEEKAKQRPASEDKVKGRMAWNFRATQKKIIMKKVLRQI